ncbi:trypsin-like peptidase domain-containing protein [Streptomyces sedi]
MEASGSRLLDAMVQVVAQDGSVAGAGFLAAGEVVMTCAHVVRAAGSGPGQSVTVRFPHLPRAPRVEGVVSAEAWRAPDAEDVAAVRLVRVPDSAGRAPLGSAAGCSGRRVSSFGFPAQAPDGGHYGYGTAGDLLPGERAGRLLQLTGANDLTTGFSGGPVRDEMTGLVVGMVTAISPADRYSRGVGIAYATPAEVLRDVVPGLAEQQLAPYRGLEPFTEQDADWFHGRQAVVDDVVERLRRHRLVLVLGPSGAGKSSLVRAGVLPALDESRLPGSDGWARVVARPGEDLPSELERAGLEGAATAGIGPAVEHRLTADQGSGRLLVVIDQFEELLTQPAASADQTGAGLAAIDDLLGTLEAHPKVSLLLAVRNDFYPRLAELCPQLLKAATPGLVNLPAAVTIPDLRDIITRPAHDAGAHFEDGLPERVIEDLRATDPDGRVAATLLPPLQLALVQLWDHRVDGRLTHGAYQRIGEATGALTAWCDNALDALPAGHRPTAQRLLTALVRPSDEILGIPATRQHVPLSRLKELASAGRHAEGPVPSEVVFEGTLAALSRDRIITTRTALGPDGSPGEPTAELIHDALLRDWATLRDWVDRDRRFQTWLHRATEQHHRHTESGLSADLLSGTALAEGRDWTGRLPPGIDDFLAASEHHQQASERRTRRLNTVLATLLALALIATGFAFWQQQAADAARNDALAARNEAQSRQLAAQSQALFDTNPELASLMAVSAYRTSPTAEARASLLRAADRKLVGLLPTEQEVTSLAFSPDGRTLASGGVDFVDGVGVVRLWDVETGQPQADLPSASDMVTSVAFSPDGETLASGSHGLVRLWDVATGQPHGEPLTHDNGVETVAFSPDGKTLASGGSNLDNGTGVVQFWDVATGQPHGEPLTHDRWVGSVAFSPDGKTLASGSTALEDREGLVRMWDVATGQPHGEPLTHDNGVETVAFSPDGKTLASGSLDNTVRLWDAKSGQLRGAPFLQSGAVESVVFSPSGDSLAGAGWDGLVRMWDVRTGQPHGEPRLHGDGLTSVAFSPDGETLASGSSSPDGVEGAVRLWGAATDHLRGTPLVNGNGVRSLAFSPDGKILATVSSSGAVRLWNVRTGQPHGEPLTHDDAVDSVAFSPDGKTLASGGTDLEGVEGVVHFWDVSSRQPLGEPLVHDERVSSVAFSPDGKTLASGSLDSTVRLWNVRTGQPHGEPLTHDDAVDSVAFSPDGKTLASGNTDFGTVHLWDLRSGQPLGDPFTHEGGVSSVAFSPDGETLASSTSPDGIENAEGKVHLWDVRSGQQRGEPLIHGGRVESVAFSPDGAALVSGSTDVEGGNGTVRLWNVDFPEPNEAVRQICQILNQDFTEAAPGQFYQSLPSEACP